MDNKLPDDPNYLLRVCEGLEQLRRGNRDDLRQSQVEGVQSHNRVVSDINKYLLTVATALIPIIFSLVTINEIRRKLNQRDDTLIEMALIFLFASLVFGFAHMISETLFFRKAIKSANRRLKLWASISFWPGSPTLGKVKEYLDEYELLREKTADISSEYVNESTNIFLILQGVSWLTGVLLVIVVTIGKLP